MKKIFILSSSALLVAVIFLLVYNFVFKNKPSENKNQASVEKNSSVDNKNEANSKIRAVSGESATGLFLDRKNEKINYYSIISGKIWQTGLNGEKNMNTSDNSLVSLEKALWSPSGEKTITVFPRGEGWQKDFYMNDLVEKKAIKLNAGVDNVVWDSLGTKILYKFFEESTKTASINVANPDGSNWNKIADTSMRNVSLAPIPQSSLVSYWNDGKYQEETELYIVGLNGGDTKKIFFGKLGADYNWSPNGERAIVSHLKDNSSFSMNTGLLNKEGTYTELGVPTLAAKMVWSLDNKNIYYALPSIPEGSTLPDDYKTGKITSVDTFWKINTESGEKKRLISLEEINGAYDATELSLSPSEDALFFINKSDGRIYRLDF